MGFLDFLTGGNAMDTAHGVDINKGDFEIKDADKLFGQTQDQYKLAADQQGDLQQKNSAFLNTLEASANGQGPSLAAAQMKQAQDRGLAQQLAMAQAQRGGNPAALQRELLRSQSAGNANLTQATGVASLQEQQQNRGLYNQALQGQTQQINQAVQGYLQQGMSIRQAQEQAMADYNHLNVQQALGLAQINSQQQMQQAGAQGKLIGGLFQAGASALTGGMGGAGAPPVPPFAQSAGDIYQPNMEAQYQAAQSGYANPNAGGSSATGNTRRFSGY